MMGVTKGYMFAVESECINHLIDVFPGLKVLTATSGQGWGECERDY